MRLPFLKAVSATALTILPLLAPTLGGLALTPGLTTSALAFVQEQKRSKQINPCSTNDPAVDSRIQVDSCNLGVITNKKRNVPCAVFGIINAELKNRYINQEGDCNFFFISPLNPSPH